MRSEQQKKVDTTPPRGIIIVDSSVLIKLAAPVSGAFIKPSLANAPKSLRLLETLTFLGQAGFKILIPEMVAYETASLLCDGFDVTSKFFSDYNHPPSSRAVKSFLKLSLDYGLIEIVAPSAKDPTLAALYLRTIHSICDGTTSLSSKRGSIAAENRRHIMKDYGDMAAHQLILHMPVTITPIFYLCDDRSALDIAVSLRGDISINKLTTVNFLGALFDSHLFPKMGIEVAQSDQLINDIRIYAASNGHRQGFPNHQNHTNPKNQAKFFATLIGISEFLQARQSLFSAPLVEEQPTCIVPTGTTRFMNKYQNLFASKPT